MITARTARTLTRYNKWADELIFGAVAKLPAGEATKIRTTLFKNIVHTLNHVYVIDRIFQAHLEGREHGFTARNTPDHYGSIALAPGIATLSPGYRSSTSPGAIGSPMPSSSGKCTSHSWAAA